jgi:small subunit ribosomal protein S21
MTESAKAEKKSFQSSDRLEAAEDLYSLASLIKHFRNVWRYMVKLTVRERESIQEAVRRFRKLVERSGIKKEMRKREFFEKPSETKRRARLRAERRTKRNRLLGV